MSQPITHDRSLHYKMQVKYPIEVDTAWHFSFRLTISGTWERGDSALCARCADCARRAHSARGDSKGETALPYLPQPSHAGFPEVPSRSDLFQNAVFDYLPIQEFDGVIDVPLCDFDLHLFPLSFLRKQKGCLRIHIKQPF